MKREVAIGVQDFEKLQIRNAFYVDKTGFIREWWKGNDDVTLITRPRRFGKTLNLSMLNCFFSLDYAGRGALFEGLKVWEDEEMRAQQGVWPVIFFSLAAVKMSTYEQTRKSINQMITDLYNRYTDLLQSKGFTESDRAFFRQVNPEMPDYVAAASVKKLCDWLYRFYGKKVLILLDEYDTPLQEAYLHGFWDEMVGYTRALFNSTFKTNPSMERGIMTGITRISRESVFSDLNNLTVITTTSSRYADSFGFTEEEVYAALREQGYGEKEQKEVKQWYDGFTFGSVTEIYNPWSVTNYLKEGKLETYWANTSGNALVGKLIREGDPEIKRQFETLLRGETIEVPIDEQIVFNQLDHDRDAVWSLLLASGYLKVVPGQQLKEASPWHLRNYTLTLTNLEVHIMFLEMVQNWFKTGEPLNTFVASMLAGETTEMENYLNDLMLRSMSFFDGTRKPGQERPECFYHGLVLGLLADQSDCYLVKSNRESGYGRYDVMLEPVREGLPAVILEFKVYDARKGERTLEDTAQNALKQIEEKRYATELLSRGIPSEGILIYGLAFRNKECLIRKGNSYSAVLTSTDFPENAIPYLTTLLTPRS